MWASGDARARTKHDNPLASAVPARPRHGREYARAGPVAPLRQRRPGQRDVRERALRRRRGPRLRPETSKRRSATRAKAFGTCGKLLISASEARQRAYDGDRGAWPAARLERAEASAELSCRAAFASASSAAAWRASASLSARMRSATPSCGAAGSVQLHSPAHAEAGMLGKWVPGTFDPPRQPWPAPTACRPPAAPRGSTRQRRGRACAPCASRAPGGGACAASISPWRPPGGEGVEA